MMKTLVLALALASAPALLYAGEIDWSDPAAVQQAALDHSAALRAAVADIQVAKERRVAAGVLANPMLMGGVQNLPVDASNDDMTMIMVGASQTFTRTARRQIERRAADLEVVFLQRRLEALRAAIARDVLFAWLDGAAAANALSATGELSQLLDDIVAAARFRYEAGLAPQADLIRAMLEQNNLQHTIISLRNRRSRAVQQLLALLDLPASTDVPRFTLVHAMSHHDAEPIDTVLADDAPTIAALESQSARAEESLRLAQLATKPDWNLEASYGVRPEMTDMISVVARIELPLRKSATVAPRIREAIAQREAAQQQIEVLRQQLRTDLAAAVTARAEAIEQINLHVDTLVPQSKLAFESSLASYQTGKSTFDAVLESLRQYLSLSIDFYDYARAKEEAEADIAALRKGVRGRGVAAVGSTEMSSSSWSVSPAGMK
jgi:outer membrane protein TolC